MSGRDESKRLTSTGIPATGSTDERDTELLPEEEPVTTGTLFLVLVIMMIIAAVWVIMYLRLLDR